MSNGLPPPPDFLEIAMQAQQARRQAEQDRLQQLMMVENLRQNAIRQGQDAISSGVDAKDALGMLSYRDPFVEAHLKAMESAAKKKAALAQEQPAAQAMGQALPALASAIPGVNSEQYGQTVSAMAQSGLSEETLSPLLQQLAMQVQLGPINQMAAQQQQEADFFKLQREEREKARIQQSKELAVARGKEEIADTYSVRRDEDALLARSVANGEMKFEDVQAQFRGDPNGDIRAQRVFVKAIQDKIALAPLNEVKESLRADGVPVDALPPTLLKRLVPGTDSNGNAVLPTAFLSPTTGLPLLGKEGSKTQQTVEILEASLHQINTIEAVARFVQENRGNVPLTEAAIEQIKASLNAGLVEGDSATIYALLNVATPGIARATGEVGNLTAVEQERAKSALGSLTTVLNNPATAFSQFAAARKFIQNRLRTNYDSIPVYRNNPSLYTRRYEEARNKSIAEQLEEYRKQFGGAPPLIVREKGK